MRFIFILTFIFLSLACNGSSTNNVNKVNNPTNKTGASVPQYTFDIVKTYPHDPKAFTQGLVFYNGVFYEGTGGYRRSDDFSSSLRKVEIETGKVLQKIDLAESFFGEGITIFGGKIYQITWKEQTVFVYDLNDFKLLKQLKYSGEGWGITHDNTNLLMSDGTHIIRVVNPETFQTIRTITVLDEKNKPVMELNELEYIKGEIWANIWEKGFIVRIDPASGKILGKIDLEKLDDAQRKNDDNADVLNGIAYDEAGDRIFITGKKWKSVFEIKVKPKE